MKWTVSLALLILMVPVDPDSGGLGPFCRLAFSRRCCPRICPGAGSEGLRCWRTDCRFDTSPMAGCCMGTQSPLCELVEPP